MFEAGVNRNPVQKAGERSHPSGGKMHNTRAVSIHAIALGLCLASSAIGLANNQKLQKEVPDVIGRSSKLGHTNASKLLHVTVSLPYGDAAGMQSFVDSVSNPSSPNYHQYITPDEIGQRFGLSDDKVQAVESYLKSEGFKISLVSKNHLGIMADCTVDQAEKAFGTTINDYAVNDAAHENGNPNYFSFSTSLQAPAAIAPYILDVSGLESFTKPHKTAALTCTQGRTLYGEAPLYSAGMQGQGRHIAISNWDGYRLSNTSLYYSHFGLPTPSGGVLSNIHVISIDGANGGTASVGAEGDLDIQMEAGMAPLADIYIYDNGGQSDLLGVITREANDNIADVISESYGWNVSGTTLTSVHNEHLSMTAEGITYMAATGDSGTSLEPYSYPDYDPEVLLIGGTVATTDTNGNRTSEVGWADGGGGWSTNTASFNTLPSWQHGNGVPTTNNHRLLPDLAFNAAGNGTGAYQFYLNGAITSGYVGTSFASPCTAGELAVAEQQIVSSVGGTGRFGRIQDLIYSQNGTSSIYFDITSGSNGTLPDGTTSSAHAGWDYVSGWGPINWQAFASSQSGPPVPDFSMSTTPSSQTVTVGSGTSYSVSTSALNGDTAPITLSVSGLPTGATGTFTNNNITPGNGSTLNITTLATTTTGTFTLTVQGTDGTHTHNNTVTLVVNPVQVADFTITASPASRSVRHGRSTTFTVTVGAVNGFTGSVALSVTGFGSGGSGTFSPTSITTSGNSTLTVRTTTGATRGTFTLTIKGVSGSLSHTKTVTLTVT